MLARRAFAVALVVILGLGIWQLTRGGDPPPAERLSASDRTFDSNDPMTRACALDQAFLVRLWRGHHRTHSEDVTTVPQAPNYSGSFGVTSHSGPWQYVQNIPLVLYGPEHIAAAGTVDRPASITDVFPTIGTLAQVDLPTRAGSELTEAIRSDHPPRLTVVVVWDGVGRNVLEYHSDAWPNLKRIERDGTSYLGATVGSSPSITPATHSSLGVGDFPRAHGVTAIEYRTDEGDVRGAFSGKDPTDLALTTFGDEIDLTLDNEPRVGMLAWKSWHIGMLGHGSATPGGDADELALINGHGQITGNPSLYSTPTGLAELEPRLPQLAAELDEDDGKLDGKSLGHDVLEMHDNPAWVNYESELLLAMLTEGDYGRDAVPDLFVTNFKITDIVAHQYSMDSQEEEAALRAQDAALGDLIDYLDEEVHDYVVIVTADHGNTPSPSRSGAWPVLQGQLQEDVDASFDVPKDESLIEQTSAGGPFLDRDVMRKLDVSTADVAEFLNGYTIADNWNDSELPEGYENRGEENVFSAVYPSDWIDRVIRCSFGERTPPADFKA
jgi:hypothetical protein